jgi:PAS domain S-box-containing protein
MGGEPDDARDASNRYNTLLSLSGDGVARFEVVPPLEVDASEDAQLRHILRHSRVAECNELFAGLYGRTRGEMIGLAVRDFVPEDATARHRAIRDFIRAGYRLVYSEEEQTISGATRWLSASGLGAARHGRLAEFWLCLREISERKRAELDRERRGRILEAVAFSAARLLQPGGWRERMEEVLARLGESAQVARAWFGELDETGRAARIAFRAAWASPGHEVRLDDERIRDGVPLHDLGIEDQQEQLRAGRPVTALVRDMAEHQQQFSSRMGSRSFVAVPILSHDRWWGVLAFGETRYERQWSAPEVEALKAAAAVVGAAIERAGADQALRESEERFERLSAASFEGIAVTEDGVFVDGNEQLAQMFGLPLASVIGRPVRDFVALEDRGVVAARMGSGVEGPYQHLALRADGSSFPVEVRARALPQQGRELRVTALRDVSARVKAEERQRRLEAELRQAAEQWRQTFDALDLGILLADAEGRVIRLNRGALAAGPSSFADIAGQTLEALSGREPWRTLLELHRQIGERLSSAAAEAREPADGRAYFMLGSPWFRGAGEPPWRVLTFRDVTEYTSLQEQLRQARVMEAMGSLVAGVAHEVRNPLFSISATLDAIDSTLGERPEFAEHASLLRSQVGRLTQLTRDLLDYGRPQALTRAPTDLAGVVRRAVRACATPSRDRRVEVQERLAADLPRLELDAARMEQALENLLTNALQHSPEGSRVTVSAEVASRDGARFVRCAVEDEGAGLLPENIGRVFEPFFTRRKGGTGLGLSIVRRLVEAHGGEVTVENRETRGARFSVWLPLARAEEESERG